MSIQLETSEFGIIVRYRDRDGAIHSKIVDPKDVADAFASRATMNTGLMPRNTRYYIRLANKEVIALEVPEHLGVISYPLLEKEFSVPIPNLVFFIEFVQIGANGKLRIINTKVFASMGPVLSVDSMLYKFPYGNTYANGDVCWGQTADFSNLTSTVDLSIVPMTLLLSDFSSDLSTGKITPFTYMKEVTCGESIEINVLTSEHLLQYLDGEGVFPYKVLRKESSFGAILRDLS